MTASKSQFSQDLRIIWAIFAKDLVDSLKNKTTLAILIPAIALVAFYRFLPSITHGDDPINVRIYDQNESSLVALLEDESYDLRVFRYDTEEAMKTELKDGDLPELGLVIPAGYEDAISGGDIPELQGYIMHWVTEEQEIELLTGVESEIAAITGIPVTIHIDDQPLFPEPRSFAAVSAGMSIAYALMIIGITYSPNIMLEEKATRTIDAIMASPADAWHLTVGKALSSLFYTIVCVGIGFLFFRPFIIQWPVAWIAVLFGAFFAISTGIFLGTVVDNRQQLALWSWALFVPVFLPLIVVLLDDLFPEIVTRIAEWIPTVAFFNLLRVSFSNQFSWVLIFPDIGKLFLWGLIPFLGTIWVLKRSDR